MAEYASKGVAGAGLGTGIAGLSLSVLNALGNGNNGGGLLSLLGGNGNYVSRTELAMSQELAAKDARIGLLEADKYTDSKIVEATAYLMGEMKEIRNEVRANKDEQAGINLQQAVYNGTNTAAVGCIQAQVAALHGITKIVIPNSSVCPGWGNVTVASAGAATT